MDRNGATLAMCGEWVVGTPTGWRLRFRNFEQVAIYRPLQMRVKVRFRFLDSEEAVVALVLRDHFLQAKGLQREEHQVGRSQARFGHARLPPSVSNRMLRRAAGPRPKRSPRWGRFLPGPAEFAEELAISV